MVVSPSTIHNYFNLIQVDETTAKSEPPYICGPLTPNRSFGGLLVSQAVNSFTTLFPSHIPHTINYKFLSPVQTSLPLHFKVRNFDEAKIVSVFAYQNDKLVGIGHVRSTAEVELHANLYFISPDYGPPDQYPTLAEVALSRPSPTRETFLELSKYPLDVRFIESPLYTLSNVNRTAAWLKIKNKFRNDLKSTNGLSVALFMSDFIVFRVVLEIYLKAEFSMHGSSLHHSVWIHEANPDPFGWFLIVSECQSISHGRARINMRLFNKSLKCVLTVVQEAYFQRVGIRTPKL